MSIKSNELINRFLDQVAMPGDSPVKGQRALVVYTALFGEKESIADPLESLLGHETDLEITFICFTDNPNLRSDVWRIHLCDRGPLGGEKYSRRCKAMPHLYLADWRYSLYVDNTVRFKRLPNSSDLHHDQTPYLFRLFRHDTRERLIMEADVISMIGYEDAQTVIRQLAAYEQIESLESITPLSTCTVMFREHHHPTIIKHGEMWWDNILAFSKRDQLSFDFCRRLSGCEVSYFDGVKHDNDLIHPTLDFRPGRIKANFDEQRYAWLHRDQPDALLNPRRHYLSNTLAHHEDYSKRSDFLDYLFFRQKSPLGGYWSPRRDLAGAISDRLAFLRTKGEGAVLYLLVRSDHPRALGHDEVQNTLSALGFYFSGMVARYLDTEDSESGMKNTAKLLADCQYKPTLLFCMGLHNQSHLEGLLLHMLVDSVRTVVLVFDESLNTGSVIRISQFFHQHTDQDVVVSFHHGHHDDMREPLLNCLVIASW